MEPTVATQYGDVPLEKLIHHYAVYREQEKKKAEKRNEFNQTEEGKELNRSRAKSYYERNRELILAKRKAKYIQKKLEAAIENE